jgi:hypothetical protein
MRYLAPEFIAALQDNTSQLFYFVKLHFNIPWHLSTLPFNRIWNGITWEGVGEVGSVSAISNSTDTEPSGFTLTLQNIYNNNVALALTENIQGKKVDLYIGLLDINNAVVPNPVGPISAVVDSVEAMTGRETSTLTITCLDESNTANKPQILVYSDAVQQGLFLGDDFLKHISSTAQKTIYF